MNYKVVIVGNAQSGKTTYIRRLLTGEYTKNYIPTLGVEVHPLVFHTNKGIVTFNVWDCAGDERYAGLDDGYFIGADAAIVFCTNENDEKHITKFRRVCDKTCPVVRVCSKYDVLNNKNDYNVDYFISAKSNYHFEMPFLHLARSLSGHDDLQFVDAPAIAPPVVVTL